MTTDKERKMIALMLRSYSADDLKYSDPICELVSSIGIDCIGFETCHGSNETPECVERVFKRLADLIEPYGYDPGPRDLAKAWGVEIMPTDEERRKVAHRLRGAPYRIYLVGPNEYERDYVGMFCDLAQAIGFDVKDKPEWDDVLMRLADLIDPQTNSQEISQYPSLSDTPECDRDALLALADEVHELAINQDIHLFNTVRVHESTLYTIEQCIREACGVSENGSK